MKHLQFLIPALIFIPIGLPAQGWLPVLTNETCHFRLADSSHITHSIRIDSVKVQGSDIVYFLNRIVTRHDNDGEPFALNKQGQFLGQTMTQKLNGSLVFDAENLFIDTSVIIFPNAALGESWVAVVDGNVSASISSMGEAQILGTLDSIKTLHFTNGAEWVLSKNHGIYKIPDFNNDNATATLSGLENQGIGDRLYRFEDFFEFNVGDVFENSTAFSGDQAWGNTFVKTVILEKSILPDGFRYFIARKQKSVTYGAFPSTIIKTDSVQIEYLRSQNKNVEAYNNQANSLAGSPHFNHEISIAHYLDGGLELGNSFPGLCSVLEYPTDPDNYLTYIEHALDCAPENGNGLYQYYESFRPKIGRVSSYISVIDYSANSWLSGAVIQGDTLWGSIAPDWFYTDTRTQSQSEDLILSPNPTTGTINFDIPLRLENCAIQVVNANGVSQHSSIIWGSGSAKLELASLSNGIYTVVLRSDHAICRGRLVKTSD